MVDQADDGTDAEPAQLVQPLVGEAPVGALDPVGCGRLPQHRIADRLQAQVGEAGQVGEAPGVAGAVELGEDAVADPVDGALDTAPQLERAGRLAGPGGDAGRHQGRFQNGARDRSSATAPLAAHNMALQRPALEASG